MQLYLKQMSIMNKITRRLIVDRPKGVTITIIRQALCTILNAAQDHKANVNCIEIETYIHSCDICIDP